jgi:hypothetical protein
MIPLRARQDARRDMFQPMACICAAAYSLLVKEKKFSYLWRVPPVSDGPQPLQPPVAEVARGIRRVAEAGAPRRSLRALTEQLWLAGALMQFSDFNSAPATVLATPWAELAELHAEIVRNGTVAPLTFAEQFAVAHGQVGGRLDEALWRLFIASRFFARWSDTLLVIGVPSIPDREKLVLMQSWERALAACKHGDDLRQQDVAGDTYYAWTHALADVRFMGEGAGFFDRLLGRVFSSGTMLMQLLINHPLSPARTESDHKQAARYGNAIGRALSAS